MSEVSEAGGVGALTVVTTVRNLSGGRIPDATPAFLADWDLDGGETVRWSTEMQALVAEARDGGGAIAVLASEGVVVGRASVPLGTPAPGGAYEPDSGVLWDSFEEADKLDLVTGADASGLPGFSTATDLADWLVRVLGLPFRDAHHITGALVAKAEGKGCDLPDLTLEDMQSVHAQITADVFDVLGVQNSVNSRISYGGTAPDQVRYQIGRWKKVLG